MFCLLSFALNWIEQISSTVKNPQVYFHSYDLFNNHIIYLCHLVKWSKSPFQNTVFYLQFFPTIPFKKS